MAQSEDIACGLPVFLDSSSSAPGLAVSLGSLFFQTDCVTATNPVVQSSSMTLRFFLLVLTRL